MSGRVVAFIGELSENFNIKFSDWTPLRIAAATCSATLGAVVIYGQLTHQVDIASLIFIYRKES